MHDEQKSNPMPTPLFWTIKAVLSDNQTIIDSPHDFVYEINRPEVKERVRLLGLFYNGQYRGSIELLAPDQRLILIRRVQQDFGEDGQTVGPPRIVILAGWQSTIGGRNVKFIVRLYENGEIVVGNTDGRRD